MNSADFCSLLSVCCCLFVRSFAWIFCVATHAIAGEDLEAAAGAGAEQQAEVRVVLIVSCVLVVGISSLCFSIELNTELKTFYFIWYASVSVLLRVHSECILNAF